VEQRNRDIWKTTDDGDKKQLRPKFELERVFPVTGTHKDVDLSERVRSGELQGFLLIAEDALKEFDEGERPPGFRALSYHTDEPTFIELPRWLGKVINEDQRRRRIEAADLDQKLVNRLNRRIPLDTYGLTKQRADGSVDKGEKENRLRTFGLPAIAVMLLFMLVMTSAPQLMTNILEEKSQRISEVLVSLVSPFNLLMGKLMGGVLISLTLALMYLGGVFWATHHFGVSQFVPASTYGWFLLMTVFALFMYGSMFSALGSACSEVRDSQSMVMPAMMIVMIPLFSAFPIIESPNGTLAQIMTFVPTATPMILLLRLVTQPGPPPIEIGFALLDCIVTTLVLVWASGKIFRIGVLSQGQTPTFRNLIGWLLSK